MTFFKKMVFKVAKRGSNINSTNMSDFIFNSEASTAKTYLGSDPPHGTILPFTYGSEPIAGRTNLLTFEHKYGFTPGILSYFSFDGDVYYKMPFRFGVDFMSGSYQEYDAYADEKNIYIDLRRYGTVWATASGTTVYVKYRVIDIVGMI